MNHKNKHIKLYSVIVIVFILFIVIWFFINNTNKDKVITIRSTATIVPTKAIVFSQTPNATPTPKIMSNLPGILPVSTSSIKHSTQVALEVVASDKQDKGGGTLLYTPEQADKYLSTHLPWRDSAFMIYRWKAKEYIVELYKKPYATSKLNAEAIFKAHGLQDMSQFTIQWINR